MMVLNSNANNKNCGANNNNQGVNDKNNNLNSGVNVNATSNKPVQSSSNLKDLKEANLPLNCNNGNTNK